MKGWLVCLVASGALATVACSRSTEPPLTAEQRVAAAEAKLRDIERQSSGSQVGAEATYDINWRAEQELQLAREELERVTGVPVATTEKRRRSY